MGRELVEGIVAAARRIGYRRMRLDTIPSLKAALSLYRSLGFRVIAPYRAIPSERALFLELKLEPQGSPRRDLHNPADRSGIDLAG